MTMTKVVGKASSPIQRTQNSEDKMTYTEDSKSIVCNVSVISISIPYHNTYFQPIQFVHISEKIV